ncbi:CHAT domain-containing protein, partial [candidate division KSB1 bacterium]|nr:CHAT domain-containing protein [candidate division KSB1 bacterium]
RRAFQLAGANTVVMSQWQVPDKETQELMVDFYKRMQAGNGKSKALRQVQLAMIEKSRQRQGFAHPFFWGAFVCVGEAE